MDLKKAYDSISWDFLHEMLIALEFPVCFTKWIMLCVTSPKYSIFFFNGGLHGYFPGRKGLRQGDPLSPLLFVLCMEYLSRILNKVGTVPSFKYHSMCKAISLHFSLPMI